ncbi:MAG: hypothetical protein IJJ92_05545 [Clostridia bacterium]|nr:hypothetical protein [Clostridia bacterium]
MEYIVNLVLLFFAYSLLGWCIEVTLKYFQFHRFINRGFFTGPILPIYGSGAALITIFVGGLSPFESAYGTTFALSFLICGAVEYLTSYFMEKRFHARWWDYSQKPMNLHGRVWIGNLILFGLGGVAIIHFINPVLYRIFDSIPLSVKEAVSCVLLALFSADFILTHFVLKLVKIGVEKSEADNTEEIRKEVYLLLSDKSVFHKRFADAYPEVTYRTERISARIAEAKAEAEKMRREAEKRLAEYRETVSDKLEPSVLINSEIISRQDALIAMLYDEQNATDEMKALKEDIDRDKARLESRPISKIVSSLK